MDTLEERMDTEDIYKLLATTLFVRILDKDSKLCIPMETAIFIVASALRDFHERTPPVTDKSGHDDKH